MKKNKIIIIGGTGFIGFHLAKFLLKKNFEVISVSRNKPKKIRFLKKVKYIKANIIFKKKLLNSLKNHLDSKFIINCGGEVEHKQIKKTFLSHYKGSENIANIFLNSSLKKFIQIGSSLEYGSLKSPQSEKVVCKPESSYSRAKYLASKNLLDLYKNYNLPLVVVRPYQLYGPAQDINRFIPFVIKACLQNKYFPSSEGTQYRDFLYIDDLIDFTVTMNDPSSIAKQSIPPRNILTRIYLANLRHQKLSLKFRNRDRSVQSPSSLPKVVFSYSPAKVTNALHHEEVAQREAALRTTRNAVDDIKQLPVSGAHVEIHRALLTHYPASSAVLGQSRAAVCHPRATRRPRLLRRRPHRPRPLRRRPPR